MPVRSLEMYRQQVNITKPHKVSDFVRKSPKLFEMYRDQKGRVWCGLTRKAEEFMQEEVRLQEEHSDRAAEYVTRFLMMSVEKRLPVDKIAHFRREMGIPLDFRTGWIHSYPELFRVIRIEDSEYLDLVSWKPEWAVTELQKKSGAQKENLVPGMLDLPFPLKFPPNYQKIFRIGGKLEHFQELKYLSPYADARDLQPGTPEFDKRAVSIMHEILSFTLEKRIVTDHLTHFRREFVMPQKLMRLLLKHFGIFYVSERGKRVHVFLTEAYEGSELTEKCPLVRWKEKVLSLTGYRGRRKNIGVFDQFSNDEADGEMDVKESNNLEFISSVKDGIFDENSIMELPGFHDDYEDMKQT